MSNATAIVSLKAAAGRRSKQAASRPPVSTVCRKHRTGHWQGAGRIHLDIRGVRHAWTEGWSDESPVDNGHVHRHCAQTAPPNDVTPFISVHGPVVVLNHVRVIDGTGAPAKENQTSRNRRRQDLRRSERPGRSRYRPMPSNWIAPATPSFPASSECTIIFTTPTPIACKPGQWRDRRARVDRGGTRRTAPASVSRRGCHHDAHHRQSRALHRYQGEAAHRRRPDARSQDRSHRSLSRRQADRVFAQMHELTGADDAKRHGGLLGRRGYDFVQGLHEHHAR